MKAVVYTKYGTPDVLELVDIAKPVPNDDEVLIRVHAVSINDWDWGLLQGDTLVNRLFYGLLKPRRKILGSDIAGRVESVGKNVKHLRPGDEVFGDLSGTWGGLAEYVCARENALALKPAAMSFIEAAAIPQAGMLAVQGLIDVGKIRAGQKILINGAGGGVGTFAVQIARLYEAHLTGVDSPAKLDLLRELGFHEVIDYTRQDFTRMARRYDLILDVKTNRSPFHYTRALHPEGIYATVGGSTSRLLQILFFQPWFAVFSKRKIRIVVLKLNKDLAYMSRLFEAGKLKPVIDGPFAFEDFRKAFRHFGAGAHKGKVVIRVDVHQ